MQRRRLLWAVRLELLARQRPTERAHEPTCTCMKTDGTKFQWIEKESRCIRCGVVCPSLIPTAEGEAGRRRRPQWKARRAPHHPQGSLGPSRAARATISTGFTSRRAPRIARNISTGSQADVLREEVHRLLHAAQPRTVGVVDGLLVLSVCVTHGSVHGLGPTHIHSA